MSKRLWFLCSVIAVTALLIYLWRARFLLWDSRSEGPLISFNATLYDLGTVYLNQRVSRVIPFRNIGSKPLVTYKVTSTCGCTVALISDEEVLPEQEGKLRVTVLGSKRGRQQHSVSIFSNSVGDNPFYLTIAVNVVPDIEIIPRVINFGNVPMGQNLSRSLRIIIRGDRRRTKVLSIKSLSEHLSVMLVDKSQTGVDKEVLVKLKGNCGPGPLDSMIIIHTTSKWQHTIRIPVCANIIGKIKVRPKSIFFGSIDQGSEKACNVIVSSINGAPFTITSISCDKSLVKWHIYKEMSCRYRLEVSLYARETPRFISCRIELVTSISEGHIIKIPVYALISGTERR